MDKQKPIDPKKFYTLGEIVRDQLIPGIDTVQKASNLVRTDRVRENILKAVMVQRGIRGVKYKVRGENIINWLAQRYG